MKKRQLSIVLIIALMIQMFSGMSFAIDLGNDIVVDNVRYVREHNGFNLISSFVEISGTGLQGKTIRFENVGLGGGFETMGQQTVNEDGFVKFVFDQEESNIFGGRIQINGKIIDLDLGNFPNITGADKNNVNVDNLDDITFYGNYLNNIGNDGIVAEFGKGAQQKTFTDSGIINQSENELTLEDPRAPGDMGFQSIKISRLTSPPASDPQISVENFYANSFRIIEDLDITNLKMYPNTGARGDRVNVTGDGFNDTKDYHVYFLKALDGSDDYSSQNEGEIISLQLDVNGTEDQLSFTVPDDPNFELRSYYIVVTDVKGSDVIAEQVVKKDDGDGGFELDQFTVIDSSYQPTIQQVYPESGSDAGSSVQISGRNILTLNIPDLIATSVISEEASDATNETLHLTYDRGEYQGEAVTINRYITVQIGRKATFQKDSNGKFIITQGTPDRIALNTSDIDDAVDDPFKDIVIEIETVMVGDDTDRTYTFNQIVTRPDGFEFIPSTLTPIIESIVPNLLQVKDNFTLNKFAKDTLFSIKGDQFLVGREVTENGDIITKLPTALIRKDDTNTFENRYQVGFFPQEVWEKNGVVVRGLIKYQDENNVEHIVMGSDERPIELEMKVVDENGAIVNGISGNEVGQKILVTIPTETLIEDIGIKHVQVTNIMRNSDQYGDASILSDSIEVIKTPEVPIIESVNPHIVTVEGEDGIEVIGSNFQEGVAVYLDGEEITPVERIIDNQGERIVLKFDAPAGREGTTQLQVMNPSGGLDVHPFTYVRTFNKDPILESFTPEQGTSNTLVVVNGDNYLRPDPTAASTTGLDAFRLIGSRIYLDGKDINQYNYDSYGNILFNPYVAPDQEKLIIEEGEKALYSSFKENTYIQRDRDGKLFALENDPQRDPLFTDGINDYIIRYEGSGFNAYDANNVLLGKVTINMDTIVIEGVATFNVFMGNKVLSIKKDNKGVKYADTADYVTSIMLQDTPGVYYTLRKNLDDEIIISNGRDEEYVVTYDPMGTFDTPFIATDGTDAPVALIVEENQVILNGNPLTFITPYTIDQPDRREIVGHKTKILNRQQITFNVPVLQTGRGFKDIFVVNPDTKSAGYTDEEGFYYIEQSLSNPVISSIKPNKGSVEGGYRILIEGKEFEEDSKVYIDGQLVPSEDTETNIDGSAIIVRVPAINKDLANDFGVDELSVPIVVLNKDGGSAFKENGFTYVIPISSPEIEEVIETTGSANGGEIVELIGYEFRFFEPYTNKIGGPEYNPQYTDDGEYIGDPYEEIYYNGKWDNLLDPIDQEAIKEVPMDHPDYDVYYESDILPSIYFGETKAKIVEFTNGYIRVISPPHREGTVELYLVNNDYGVSNKINYEYIASNPTINVIDPNVGKRQGQEHKDIYGRQLDRMNIYGYQDDIDDDITKIDAVEANVRFGSIDNTDTPYTDPNSGRIVGGTAEVNLLGGLKVSYNNGGNEINVQIEENNDRYSRTFENYDDSAVYLPTEMLKNTEGKYYTPYMYDANDGSIYTGTRYEFIKVYIENRRMYVERGYVPRSTYDNSNHVSVRTPNYHTIDPVTVTYSNADGGQGTVDFTYTNPASDPKILSINPRTLSIDKDRWLVNGTIGGEKEIEIIGKDFRDGLQITINGKNLDVKEIAAVTLRGETYQSIIAQIPAATEAQLEEEFPIVIINEDSGLANSALVENLLDPIDGNEKIPYYFEYKKPLSGPEIDSITPSETSVAGGNKIIIQGKDFRPNGYVIIGSRGGVPVYNIEVNENGSILSFDTPKGLTIGEKNLQVLNEDFGISIVEKGIKIISNPSLRDNVYDANGSRIVTRVSVEGGDEITIKGEGFLENSTVLFGGTYNEVTDENANGNIGLNAKDERYIVENGIEAQNVEFIDSETLRVTTPAIEKEREYNIVVINEDGGISQDNASIGYKVPVPANPIGLKAEVINDRYIRLYDYVADDADYFEIYTYQGRKSNNAIINDYYKDFNYVDTTSIEPYKMTSLPGVENIQKDEKLLVVLKAVNKYGPSSWSNIATLTYDNLKDIEKIGPPDTDGDLGVPEGQNYDYDSGANDVIVNITDKTIDSTVGISLSNLKDKQKKIINIPSNKVRSNRSLIAIDFGDTKLQFTPISLNTKEFRDLDFYNDTYGRISNQWIDDQYSSILKSYLPRGKRAISKVYSIEFTTLNNETSREIKFLNGGVNFGMTYNRDYLRSGESVDLYKFDGVNQWYRVNANHNAATSTLTTTARTAGKYIILK